MAEFYTTTQIDSIMSGIGSRVKARTTGAALKAAYEGQANTNAFTDAEKAKLATLEGSKFKGTFASLGVIPTVGMAAGDYAHVDAGAGQNAILALYDATDSEWVLGGGVAGETAASVKTKYESNPDTNAFTDAEKAKLSGIVEAANVTAAIAALDAALA